MPGFKLSIFIHIKIISRSLYRQFIFSISPNTTHTNTHAHAHAHTHACTCTHTQRQPTFSVCDSVLKGFEKGLQLDVKKIKVLGLLLKPLHTE